MSLITQQLTWRAVYDNGTFEDEHYDKIKRDKLIRFDIISKETNETVYSIELNKYCTAAFRRRKDADIHGNIKKEVIILAKIWSYQIQYFRIDENLQVTEIEQATKSGDDRHFMLTKDELKYFGKKQPVEVL